jgi:hypothetical protein
MYRLLTEKNEAYPAIDANAMMKGICHTEQTPSAPILLTIDRKSLNFS